MFRISKLTDYGTVILVFLAGQERCLCSASEVATGTHVALPTVQKLLKLLAKTGFVDSARGSDGGYRLSRDPGSITAMQVLDALEGPVGITECSADDGDCALESLCQVGNAWQKINAAIRLALSEITLADLRHPPARAPLLDLRRDVDDRPAPMN